MNENMNHGYRAIGILLTVVTIAAMMLIGIAPASAGGARERDDAADGVRQRATGPLSGEVVAVATLADGALELTVRQPDGATVYVEIPAALARSLRILEGDLVRTTEHEMARDGERLRVQTITIDRNR